MQDPGTLGSLPDTDPLETREWLDSIEAVVREKGASRARFLVRELLHKARMLELHLPSLVQTPYINTIPPDEEPPYPGDERIELRIRRLIRWNAVAMVIRANRQHPGIGGHMATYASSATLYETGFNHFFRGKEDGQAGDQIFFQGHAAPGIYARAFLEGRLSVEQLEHFRREISMRGGLPSYPHPHTMPDFWEFPTVSMGLGPLNAIYQARFNRYLLARGIADTKASRVWCFLGDGETDEPEALGALALASRERLGNLIFVVNCNLQRLDGPVRGNGKIIQELEARFKGAGWNVIKVIWGREWDDLLARDDEGLLLQRMEETVDGQFQKYSVSEGDYIRDHFFGKSPVLRRLVDSLTDEQLKHIRRGGHDFRKVYAAYKAATDMTEAPTAILAHTVKGWTLGGFQGSNVTHQAKKLDRDELRAFRDRIHIEIPDGELDKAPFFHPGPDSEEVQYLLERRRALRGCVPVRSVRKASIVVPERSVYEEFLEGTKEGQEVSTTMAAVRLLSKLLKDPGIGRRIVPIIPDEARTFGMEAWFRSIGIYAPQGQVYEPVDKAMLLYYKESRDGQMLMEGITEAGAMASFTAAGTSYATHGEPMIPFYFFYSMFGFQRIGDMAWAFGDSRGRGFVMGATAGRTTLNGEGLQHQDGHSHVLATTFPNLLAYDPAFAYEIAVIVEEGLRRMVKEEEDVFYYLTLQNENYTMPPMPAGVEEGILAGLYPLRPSPIASEKKVRLLGSGSILLQVLRAQEILAERYGVAAEVFSATGYKELRRDALACERWNRWHPDREPRVPWIARVLPPGGGPVVAASDSMKLHADQIARWVADPWVSLGTDGFGASDTREVLRRYFEVDAETIAAAALSRLAGTGALQPRAVAKAIRELGLDPEKVDPAAV